MRRYLAATFSSLRNRNYRLYAGGQTISVTGTWMQKVAQVWIVLELTDSGTLLGVTAALQQVPTLLFTAWGGLLADRFDKRKILLLTQTLSAIPAVLLGVLTATGDITIWLVFVFAVLLGCIDAMDRPARITFINDIVGKEDLTNAVTLNSIIQNGGKVVGPAVAGVLIATVGVAASFLINAASFVAVLAALLMMRPDLIKKPAPAVRAKGQLREGLRYVRSQPDLFGVLVLMAVTGLFAYNWTVVLPIFVRDSFGGGASEVGLTFTAMGLGAIVGGLAIAGSLDATVPRLLTSGLVFAGFMLALAFSGSLLVVYVLLFVLGAASVSFRAVGSSMLQLRADPMMRGRVISLLVIAMAGTTPIGGPLMGWISEAFGAGDALALGAITTALAGFWAMGYMRKTGRRMPLPTDETSVAQRS